jgi:hypothetical protein
MSDAELIEIARRSQWPIVHIPCDTAAGREVATVNLMLVPPLVMRRAPERRPVL